MQTVVTDRVYCQLHSKMLLMPATVTVLLTFVDQRALRQLVYVKETFAVKQQNMAASCDDEVSDDAKALDVCFIVYCMRHSISGLDTLQLPLSFIEL